MFERLLALINETQFAKIEQAKILLVGIGGVGGYALEALVRSGFKDITIVDGDNIELSNLNRQILANQENIGCSKVTVAKKRVLSINPNVLIKGIEVYLTQNNFDYYIKEQYDYIIDACDTIEIKIKLIEYAKKSQSQIVTCLGTGKKLNPAKLEITTLNKTYNDPLAKKLRYLLRKKGISLNIPVVFSKEEAKNTKDIIGSAIFVPGSAGLLLANYIFMDVIK